MDANQAQLTKQMLDRAALAIKRGAIREGRARLDDVLERDPNNILALLWYTKCVRSPAEKLHYFKRVLELDPGNPHALKGIDLYSSRPPFEHSLTLGSRRPETAPPASPRLDLATRSAAAQQSGFRKPSPRRPLHVVGVALAAIAGITCLCVASGLLPGFGSAVGTSKPSPAPGCDIAAAVAFEDQIIEVEMSIVGLLGDKLTHQEGPTGSSLDTAASLVRDYQQMLSSSNDVPDCYHSILQASLQYNQAAARHYAASLDAIRRGDYATAQREFGLGIDASNSAGDAYLDAICRVDVAPFDPSLGTLCRRRSGR